MKGPNAGQWMALGFAIALVLCILAGAVEELRDRPEATMHLMGVVRLAAGLALMAFALAVHRAISRESVSGLLVVGVAFGTLVAFVGLDQLRSGFATLADGTYLGTRADVVMLTALAAASIAPLRGHPAAPSYAWKATAVIAALGAVSVVASLWYPPVIRVGSFATGMWALSASFFAWQAARLQVRPGAARGWALSR